MTCTHTTTCKSKCICVLCPTMCIVKWTVCILTSCTELLLPNQILVCRLGTGKAYQQKPLFEKKCAPWKQSPKECLTITCCRNASRNHKLKLVVSGKAQNHNCSRVMEQTVYLSIITIRKNHRCIGRFFKTGSTSILFHTFLIMEDITDLYDNLQNFPNAEVSFPKFLT